MGPPGAEAASEPALRASAWPSSLASVPFRFPLWPVRARSCRMAGATAPKAVSHPPCDLGPDTCISEH